MHSKMQISRSCFWIALSTAFVLGSSPSGGAAASEASRAAEINTVPLLSHIIVVVMENHSYDQVRTLPYTASLIAQYSTLTSSYAVTHPSQPNYIAMWAGATFGVSNDNCPAPGSPYSAENLGHACEAAGISWRAYSENLPSPGYSGCTAGGGLYVRKHDPWTNFSNLDHQRERPYTDLANDIAADSLPTLSYVIPNQCNNTHDCSVTVGDTWLSNNLPAMIEAVGPNGVVILTWDEDDSHSANHILTVFAGPTVKTGYSVTRTVTHYTVLRTICDALGIAPFAGATGQTPIDDLWLSSSAVSDSAPRLLSALVPNPTRSGFEARMYVPPGAVVDAAMFDASGRKLRSLSIGDHGALRWDGRRDDGRRVGTGAYFLRLRSGTEGLTEKLIVVR